MQRNRPPRMMSAVFAFVLWTALLGSNASGINGQSVFFFDRTNGTGYATGLTVDASGNIWGISPFWGAYGYGNVFELTRNAAGQWTQTVLYSFTGGSDGGIPNGNDGPLIDSAGNLYGTTNQGGLPNGGGTVFKLTHNSSGWQESVLWNFTCGNDGCVPDAGLLSDSAGNLYGTTFEGGGGTGFGTVFELSPDGSGNWNETTLYTFSGGRDGGGPQSALVLDQSGNLYGTTSYGGYSNRCVADIYGCGVIFELTKGVGGNWAEQVLYGFRGGQDGARPQRGKLAFDASGNIYGVTSICGDFSCTPYGWTGYGTVFRLAPPTSSGGQWGFSRLHAFTGGSDGAYPYAGLIVDKTGVVYGTAPEGGNGKCGFVPTPGCGTVYRITPTVSGRWDFDTLYSFSGTTDGGTPSKISLAGSTAYIPTGAGGPTEIGFCLFGCGTIFQISTTSP